MIITDLGKTKKVKRYKNSKELWGLFSSEIQKDNAQPLECVYRSSGQREYCDLCQNSLAITVIAFFKVL